MEPEKEQAVVKAYNKLLAISLKKVPIDGIEELVAPNEMGFGTTLDGKIHDLEEYVSLIRGQEEIAKAAGLDFKFDADSNPDLLKDIVTNLRKIHENGSRADSFVRSMLQHSRGGTGKMEPQN